MTDTYKVIGMREEKYIGKAVYGHNCDFTYEDEEMTRHIILLTGRWSNYKFELSLQENQGECSSGWCTASYGEFEWKQVENFAGKTHKTIKDEVFIEVDKQCLENLDDEDAESNSVFYFSECSGDSFYPSGGYTITEGVFTPIKTLPLSKRPVHIFKGESNTCKSYLAALTGKSLFETDSIESFEDLPRVLTEDIIVVGNRWTCDIDQLKTKVFGDSDIIIVNFSK